METLFALGLERAKLEPFRLSLGTYCAGLLLMPA